MSFFISSLDYNAEVDVNQYLLEFLPSIFLCGSRLCPILASFLLFYSTASAQPGRRIVPRHPAAIELPELGRMIGPHGVFHFGANVYPVEYGNSDSIGDFLVSLTVSDTTIGKEYPKELWFYKGRKGMVPSVSDRLRLGPTEIGSDTKFIACGDWDGDGYSDICTSISLYGDTTRTGSTGIQLSSMVVWWGNAEGNYSVEDTSHLELEAIDEFLRPNEGFARDLDHDGHSDLMISGIAGFDDGRIIEPAPVQVWLGMSHRRWGRDRKATSDWSWWKPKREARYWTFPRVEWIDQDADGYLDMILSNDAVSGADTGKIRVIYGKPGVIVDTGNIVELSFENASGKLSKLIDITGDNVPELILNCGHDEELKVYVGLHGQRIQDQFGSGNEPAVPNDPQWWGKPWATIPLVGQLHDGWAPSGWSKIFDFGDGGLDGVGDVWVYSVPDFICYNGGGRFDSLYDGWITRAGTAVTSYKVVGNVDGTGRRAIAVGFDYIGELRPGGIAFFLPSVDIPETGVFRNLPPGTGKPISSIKESDRGSFGLIATPNPPSGTVSIHWDIQLPGIGTPTVIITDVLGQHVLERQIESGTEFEWNTEKSFGGIYYVSLIIDDHVETTSVLLRR